MMRAGKFYLLVIVLVAAACGSPKPTLPPMFDVLDSSRTGLVFNNKLHPTPEFNMFKYMYFYNGAGVGAGEFNNDGLIDIFMSANQGDDKLYLNKGDLHFTDITK